MIDSFATVCQRFIVFDGISTCSENLAKMGMYYGEQSGKGFEAFKSLRVCEEELEKYLESWDRDEDLLGFSFMVQRMNVFWCLRYIVGNSRKIMRCYDKEDDETNLRSYRDDMLDIADYSLKEGKLLRIDF